MSVAFTLYVMTFQQQTTSSHPIDKSSGHSAIGRHEPIIIGLAAAVILAVFSLITALQDDVTLSQLIGNFGTIGAMVGGAAWARQRVVSVDTFDGRTAEYEERIVNERAAEAQRMRSELDDQLAAGIDAWTDLEESRDVGSRSEEWPFE